MQALFFDAMGTYARLTSIITSLDTRKAFIYHVF